LHDPSQGGKEEVMLKALEFMGEIDAQHQLQAQLPEGLPPGPGRIIVLIPETDAADGAWMQGMAREWAAALHDRREDLSTLEDGQPVDAAR
jgi:hypothetical protein